MQEDQAKRFQAQLLHIEQYLRKIKEIGMDTSKLEEIILKINEELKDKIKATNDSYDAKKMINNYFQEDYLENHYREAVKLLNELERKIIEEYNTYAKIDGICQEIESQLDTITKENINKFLLSIKTALNFCNTSSTQDYKNEESLFEKVYELAYQIIKKEILLTNQSELLTHINTSELDAPYLERIILKEIDSLDLSQPENKDLVIKLKSLKNRGLESNHLDSELIHLLSIPKEKEAYQEKKEEILTLDNQLDDNNKKIQKLENERKVLLTKAQKQKKEITKIIKKSLKPAGIVTIYATSWLTLTTGSLVLINKLSNDKIYPTIEKIYDIKTKTYLPPKEYDSTFLDDTIQLIKYNSWEKGRYYSFNKYNDTYRREILTYDLSEIELEDLSDYEELDLATLGIIGKEATEYKSQLTPEDLYEEAYSIIKEITQDQTEYDLKRDWFLAGAIGFGCILLLAMILVITLLIDDALRKKHCSFSECLLELKILLNSLKEYQKEIKEPIIKNKKQEINKLVNISNQLLQTLEQEYNQLPEFMQQDEELNNILKKVRKPNNS